MGSLPIVPAGGRGDRRDRPAARAGYPIASGAEYRKPPDSAQYRWTSGTALSQRPTGQRAAAAFVVRAVNTRQPRRRGPSGAIPRCGRRAGRSKRRPVPWVAHPLVRGSAPTLSTTRETVTEGPLGSGPRAGGWRRCRRAASMMRLCTASRRRRRTGQVRRSPPRPSDPTRERPRRGRPSGSGSRPG